jgi:hypothetical protein
LLILSENNLKLVCLIFIGKPFVDNKGLMYLFNHIELNGQFNKIKEKDILSLEKYINSNLPKSYKKFLLYGNGGRPTPDSFYFPKSNSYVRIHFFLGITTNSYSIRSNYKVFRNRIKDDLLIPIATDEAGNIILLDIRSEYIYFFDHELECKFMVSKSFLDFIDSLQEIEEDETQFDIAVQREDIIFFEKLLNEVGSIDNIKDEFGDSLKIVAAGFGKLKLLEFCLKYDSNIKNLLFIASTNNHLNIVEYLIEKGANLNERDDNGSTSLMQACVLGSEDIAKVLIKHGANPLLSDRYGNDVFDKAKWSNNKVINKLLSEFR